MFFRIPNGYDTKHSGNKNCGSSGADSGRKEWERIVGNCFGTDSADYFISFRVVIWWILSKVSDSYIIQIEALCAKNRTVRGAFPQHSSSSLFEGC